jgi:asparagine N-glycosylation enzyme membrane subunit Stt3
MPILSPIIYVTEFIIFVVGLLLLNGFGLGESDLGIWGMGILAIVLIFLGVAFFFGSGFVPRAYLGYDAWFGIILGVLGIFAAFRAKRRYGSFVYVR